MAIDVILLFNFCAVTAKNIAFRYFRELYQWHNSSNSVVFPKAAFNTCSSLQLYFIFACNNSALSSVLWALKPLQHLAT